MGRVSDLDITLRQIAETAAHAGNLCPDSRVWMERIFELVAAYVPIPADWERWPIPEPDLFREEP